MRRERNVQFWVFVVCMLAAAPLAWGAGVVEPAGLADSESGLSSTKAKVTMCHVRRGNPDKAVTIVVSQAAVQKHLDHGDTRGACRSLVAKTGETICSDAGGVTIACAGTGQDGEYQRGASLNPRFTDNGNGTVKDNLTGLIWLKNASCLGVQAWTDALTMSNTLSAATAPGACGLTDGSLVGDWRLPNVKELESLIDFGQFNHALPVGHPFAGVQSSLYWSSTTYANVPSYAWYVYLYDGFVNVIDKSGTGHVWPVRGGQ